MTERCPHVNVVIESSTGHPGTRMSRIVGCDDCEHMVGLPKTWMMRSGHLFVRLPLASQPKGLKAFWKWSEKML